MTLRGSEKGRIECDMALVEYELCVIIIDMSLGES
jgi:hypothetical protein